MLLVEGLTDASFAPSLVLSANGEALVVSFRLDFLPVGYLQEIFRAAHLPE
jgi:hypothetical protein